MVLTQEERDKFAQYLEEQAATNETLATEADKIGIQGISMVLRLDAKAFSHVAKRLRSTHTT